MDSRQPRTPAPLLLVAAALLLAGALPAATQTITIFPSPITIGVTQTQDFVIEVQGASQKAVTVKVCNHRGKKCGDPTLGTIAIIGMDSQNNRIARYTAPAVVPSAKCKVVADGCLVKIKAKAKKFVGMDRAAVTISASATNPVPLLSSIAPTGGAAEDPAFTLTVDGSGFLASTVVRWNGQDRVTTFVNSTRVTADIFSADLDIPEPATVTAFNDVPAGGESNGLKFSIASGAARLVERSSESSGGTQGAADSGSPAMSGSGRYLVFASNAGNLVANDTNGVSDVFWRDSCLGENGCAVKTQRMSVDTSGAQGSGASSEPSVSADGRFVVFRSFANNLVANDTNGAADIFRRDTCTGAGAGAGCVPDTIRLSVSTSGAQGDSGSSNPVISADGRYVAFASDASNLVSGDLNGVTDIFVRDTCRGAGAGCLPSTTRVSVRTNGAQGDSPSFSPAISRDGRYIAFASDAGNLVGSDLNGVTDVFVRDTCAGATNCSPTTTRVSVRTNGAEGNSPSANPSISGNGRFIAFASFADNLVGSDTNGVRDIFLRDTCAGATNCSPSTTRVSVSAAGAEANSSSFTPSISADGRFIAFGSFADNLAAGDSNGAQDVFLRDTCFGAAAGCAATTLRLSVNRNGAQAAGDSFEPSLSRDGHFVGYTSFANNLIGSDTNGAADVFLGRTGR